MKHCIAFFLGLLAFQINAQITGTVIDTENNLPLEYATVALYSTSNTQSLVTGVITNENGVYFIKRVKKGNYILECDFLGYETFKTEVNILGSKQELPLIKLAPSAAMLNEAVVRTNAVSQKIDKRVYEAKAFDNASGGTGIDLVRNIPSVVLQGNGNLTVRGSDNYVVLINGKPVQGDPNLILKQIPANAVKNVELITAPSAKYDPEGKGGLINVIMEKRFLNGSYAQINSMIGAPSVEDYDNKEAAQRYGADGTFNYVKDQWNISFGASYQRYDKSGRREGFHDPSRPEGDIFIIDPIDNEKTIFPSDGERSFNEINYSGKLNIGFAPDENNDFNLGFYAGKRDKARTADIYYNNETYQPATNGSIVKRFDYYNENLRIRRGDFMLGSFDYSHTFENESKLSSSFLYEYTLLGGPTTNRNLHTNWPENNTVYQDEYNTNDNPLYGTRLNLDYETPLDDNSKLEAGYQYRNLDHTGDFDYTRYNPNTEIWDVVPEFTSEVNLKRDIHSGYLTYNAKHNQWHYNAGVRLEHMNRDLDLEDATGTVDTTYVYDYTKLFPSAYVEYSIDDSKSIKAAYSKRVNRTTTFKMNPFREREHSETLEQGDAELKPEFIDVLELTYNKSYDNGNSLYATAYFRHTENVVNRVNRRYQYYDETLNRQVYADTILDRVYSNVGKAKSIGLELGGTFKINDKWQNLIGTNIYHYTIDGSFNGNPVDTGNWQYSVDLNSTYNFTDHNALEFNLSYLSERITAQGKDSQYYLPNLTYTHSFLDGRLNASLQWKNMDMGLLNTNEQRITTSSSGAFYTTTNYVYEVDIFLLNLSYTFNSNKNKSKFIQSEFGKREF